MRALLVDDQSLVREAIALNLQLIKSDLDVSTARNVDEARQYIAQHGAPEFIFLDIEMPTDASNAAGLDFLRELKEGGNESRVVMISAKTYKETIADAIEGGAAGFISKNTDDSSTTRHALEIILAGGVYLPTEMREARGSRPPGPPPPVTIRTVSASDLGIAAPRVYETLFHISKGAKGYKSVARKMGNISDNTVEEYARTGFRRLGVQSQVGFLVLLNENGWRLAPPPPVSPESRARP
jgi:DNA-binding NarL/FixJ family response regulator